MTGTWKLSPVEKSSTSTNSKYWSMDQSDSTASLLYPMKNLSAAGVRTEYAKIDPRVKEHGGPEHDGTEELSLILGQAREDVRDRLVQHHGSA